MEKALLDIAEQLKTIEYLDDKALTKVINRNNKRILEEERARAATEESRARTAATLKRQRIAKSERQLHPKNCEAKHHWQANRN